MLGWQFLRARLLVSRLVPQQSESGTFTLSDDPYSYKLTAPSHVTFFLFTDIAAIRPSASPCRGASRRTDRTVVPVEVVAVVVAALGSGIYLVKLGSGVGEGEREYSGP